MTLRQEFEKAFDKEVDREHWSRIEKAQWGVKWIGERCAGIFKQFNHSDAVKLHDLTKQIVDGGK